MSLGPSYLHGSATMVLLLAWCSYWHSTALTSVSLSGATFCQQVRHAPNQKHHWSSRIMFRAAAVGLTAMLPASEAVHVSKSAWGTLLKPVTALGVLLHLT